MLRFIHTADWQLGLRVAFIPGDAGALVRAARLETVRKIGRTAGECDAAFVVVAGDVFEHHALRADTVRKTFDAMRGYPCPVYLLPGNHDPLTPDSLYLSPLWEREAPPNVHVLASRDPVEVREGVWLFPCPLMERHTIDDPTDHLERDFGPQGVFRIGVAHGGIREILSKMEGGDEQLTNAVSIEAADRGGLDYLALGDWHGLLQVKSHTWYSGAPEATRFKESRPGFVLDVAIEAPGATPSVTPVPVATHAWEQRSQRVNGAADLVALQTLFDGLPDKHNTLLELHLEGTVDVQTSTRLTELTAEWADRLAWLRVRDERLTTLLDEADLDNIATDGWVRRVSDTLQAASTHDSEARNALLLLYRLHAEVSS